MNGLTSHIVKEIGLGLTPLTPYLQSISGCHQLMQAWTSHTAKGQTATFQVPTTQNLSCHMIRVNDVFMSSRCRSELVQRGSGLD